MSNKFCCFCSSCLFTVGFTPGAGGVVVGIGGGLGGTEIFGDVTEVYSDPCPG